MRSSGLRNNLGLLVGMERKRCRCPEGRLFDGLSKCASVLANDTPLGVDKSGVGHFSSSGVTQPVHTAGAILINRPKMPAGVATSAQQVTPGGARESGQPSWPAALGSGSRVPQPQ